MQYLAKRHGYLWGGVGIGSPEQLNKLTHDMKLAPQIVSDLFQHNFSFMNLVLQILPDGIS